MENVGNCEKPKKSDFLRAGMGFYAIPDKTGNFFRENFWGIYNRLTTAFFGILSAHIPRKSPTLWPLARSIFG